MSAFFRAFLIQGSWNNRTMIGGGFAFATLPILRHLFENRPEELHDAIQRHSEHFNAHPYLANLALGASLRMEEDGRDPEEIRRFKVAVRGPLGGLGDALIWAGWRPATVLASIILALAGAPPWAVVAVFLVLYNAGHLVIRAWGFRVGIELGSQVGDALRAVGFSRQASRLGRVSVFLLGGVVGLAIGWTRAIEDWPLTILVLSGGFWGFWLGSLVGQRGWRWAYWGVCGAIATVYLVGWIG
jgi:mannose/fructose/N-acetylgalactosamine-specific phosphotransferase system component IID